MLFGLAILEAFVSYVVELGSVHTYCENRPIVGALALIAAMIFGLLIRNRASAWKRILSALGLVVCSLTMASGVAFIWYATKWCHGIVGS
jgi:glucan phosphoethanolaminetransferase (alkaline phosphatase superfamily)